jgi:hypothetical protein
LTTTTNPSIWEFMIQVLPYDLTEMRRRSVMLVNTSVVVFVGEHTLGEPAVHLAKSWHKYHLLDVAEKCTDQSVGHQ